MKKVLIKKSLRYSLMDFLKINIHIFGAARSRHSPETSDTRFFINCIYNFQKRPGAHFLIQQILEKTVVKQHFYFAAETADVLEIL
jgi:hypothetical protein